MEFANDRQRKTFELVQEYVAELFEDPYYDEGTAHFYVRYGSTVLEISVDPHGPEEAVVQVMAYCVQGVELDEELLRALLELNHTMSFGAFSLIGNDIYFSHSLFGRTLERSNLLSAIAAVATVSDDYDDRIATKYGGQRALDRIRDTGGMERRRQALRLES